MIQDKYIHIYLKWQKTKDLVLKTFRNKKRHQKQQLSDLNQLGEIQANQIVHIISNIINKIVFNHNN